MKPAFRYFDIDRFKAGFPATTRDGRLARFKNDYLNTRGDDFYMHVNMEGCTDGMHGTPRDYFYTQYDGELSDVSAFPVPRFDLFMLKFDPVIATHAECLMEISANFSKMIRMEAALKKSHDTFKSYQAIQLPKVNWKTYESGKDHGHFSDPASAEASRLSDEYLMASRVCDCIPKTEFKEKE